MLLVMITYEGQWTTGVLPVRRQRTEQVLKVLRGSGHGYGADREARWPGDWRTSVAPSG